MVRNRRASAENVRERKNLTWDQKERNNSPDENNTGTLPSQNI